MDYIDKKVTLAQAAIIALKLYDRKEETGCGLFRSFYTGLQYRTILNFLYHSGITPKYLRELLDQAQNEDVCPQMQE